MQRIILNAYRGWFPYRGFLLSVRVSAAVRCACKAICILLETRLIFDSRGSNKNRQISKLWQIFKALLARVYVRPFSRRRIL
jgi:hypothetical protein